MLKKTIRRLGALAMVLAMAVSVFAVNASAAVSAELFKVYTTTATTTPKEDLMMKLQSSSATDLRVDSTIKADNIPAITLTKDKTSDKFVIGNLDALNDIGNFHYVFKEEDAGTAGVVYYTGEVYVDVLCSYGTTGAIEQSVVVYTKKGEEKTESITNAFNAGKLTVSKDVAGSLGDKTKTFTVEVKFNTTKTVRNDITYTVGNENKTISAGENGWTGTQTVRIDLKHGESITFNNVPYDVTYSVAEESYAADGYKATYKLNSADPTDTAVSDEAMDSATETVAITNTKNGSTPTGVIMTIAPYALMVVLAGAFAVVFLTRRNRAE